MARIAPFRAVRYNIAKIANLEEVVTPPYDVIDAAAQAAFVAKNPYNMIQLDLSKAMAADPGTDRYQTARQLFLRWQEEQVLLRDGQPAFYLYTTSYTHPSGKRLTRKGFISLVELADFSEGIVKPHEKTFAGVTDDRLRLMDTCQAHFSQVFSLYSDPAGEVIAALEANASREPLCSAMDQDGCEHALFAVTDPLVQARVAAFFANRSLYIADGHHRYTTALRLRELERRRRGRLAPESPYNFTVMYLCPMEDAGLSVLPTHRLVSVPAGGGLEVDDIGALVAVLEKGFVVDEVRGGSREVLLAETLSRMDEVQQHGRGSQTVFGLYHARLDRCFLLRLKEGVMAEQVGGLPEALAALDVEVLSELVLERLLGLEHARCEEEGLVDYFSDPDQALDTAVKAANADDSRSPLLFLMNPTGVDQVRRVADEELTMPHKSTYFYPKILTGLVINRIVADEQILVPGQDQACRNPS